MTQIEFLEQEGRRIFDVRIKNLSWQMTRSDSEIIEFNKNNLLTEIFGVETPAEYRNRAKRTQQQLMQQEKENFVQEYAQIQINNLTN